MAVVVSEGDRPGLSEMQWRLLWEEHCDAETRRCIWTAALRGHALDDIDQAAVAVEFCRRRKQHAFTAAIANSLVSLALLVTMGVLYQPPVNLGYWIIAMILLAAMVANPLVAGWWRRRLSECERRNRAIVAGLTEQ